MLSEFINVNKDSIADKTLIWASVKGCIRNVAIQFSSHLHKSRLRKVSQLDSKCNLLEHGLKFNYEETKENEIKSKKAELNDLL